MPQTPFPLVQPTANPTAKFLEKMKKLSERLNSSKIKQAGDKMCYAVREQSEHLSFLEHCLPWIESWRFRTSESRCQPYTIKGWQVTIKAAIFPWKKLHQESGLHTLMTHRLQEDPLQNLFGLVRPQHGCNDNPTMFQLIAGLKHILVGKLSELCAGANCKKDASFLLDELRSFPVSVLPLQEAAVLD